MIEVKICERCNIHPSKPHRNEHEKLLCIRCLNIRQNEKNRLKAKKASEEKKTIRAKNIKKCIYCEEDFSPSTSIQKQCGSYICKQTQKIKEEQDKFLKDKVDQPRQDLQKITYSFFRKKYGVSKKFTACRG